MSSTSGNLSCSTAFIFARTAAQSTMSYGSHDGNVAATRHGERTEDAHDIFAFS